MKVSKVGIIVGYPMAWYQMVLIFGDTYFLRYYSTGLRFPDLRRSPKITFGFHAIFYQSVPEIGYTSRCNESVSDE